MPFAWMGAARMFQDVLDELDATRAELAALAEKAAQIVGSEHRNAGVIAAALDHADFIARELETARRAAHIWYDGDGNPVELESAESVTARRIEAAKRIATLERERDEARVYKVAADEGAEIVGELTARIATLEAALREGLDVCEIAKDMTFAPWATRVHRLLGAALRGVEGKSPEAIAKEAEK